MELDIRQFGKGAIQTPEHIAAGKFVIKQEPLRAINWSVPYTIEQGFTLTQRDQDGSSSCTGQATVYYVEALNKIENNKDERYSARFNYSQSYAPGGGAYIWKAMSIPLNQGVASLESVPEGNSTEAEMIDQSLNNQAKIEAKADKYAQIPLQRNVDWLAQVLEDYHGFETGFNGRNDMFSPDGTANLLNGPAEWGHAVFVVGREIRNGKRCFKFKNSWSSYWGSNGYGYFPEEFITQGPIFDAYVYALVEDIDPNSMTQALTDVQLNNLWLAVFKRPIDAGGLAFYRGKSYDTVMQDVLGSKENKYYGDVFKATKAMEDAIRTGQF